MKTELEIRDALDAAARFLENTPNASKRLLFVAESMRNFLGRTQPTLDHAFGLKKGRGQYVREDNGHHIELVRSALQMRLEGKSFRAISEAIGYGEKEFKELWDRYLPMVVSQFVTEKIDERWSE